MRLVREETGVALAAALGVLAVVSVLSASVFAVSLQVTDTSTASRDAKRALAAADAGLAAAVFRLNQLGFRDEDKCFTTLGVAPGTGVDGLTGLAPAAGQCPGLKENAGNGTSYTYYVTPALSDGDVCAGLPVKNTDNTGLVTITQRCVTSVGLANGQRRRVQARVASYIGAQLFPVGGILAINGIKAANTTIVGGVLGSNGQINLGNNSIVNAGIQLGSVSSPPPIMGSGSTIGPGVSYRSEEQGAFVLAPVDMGNTATQNDNARLTNTSPPKDTGTNVTYDAALRNLTVGTNGSLTLGGGTYNFCKVTLGNGAIVTVAQSATVRFFLDSPDRTGSGCIPPGMTAAQARAAGWGGMVLGQGSNFTYSFGHAIHLQMYFYGYNDGSHTIEFNNTSNMNAAIYAPSSTLIYKNSGTVSGGIAASKVEFKNTANFTWAGESGGFDLSDLRTDTVSVYYRMAWAECQRNPTAATDPESGC